MYAALRDNRVGDARALSEPQAASGAGCFVGVSKRRDGGFIIYGGRIVLRISARGAIESHTVKSDCVEYADETVTITKRIVEQDGISFQRHELTGAEAHPVVLDVDDARAQASSDWVVVAGEGDSGGDYIAWPRGSATVQRGTIDEGSAKLAGRYFVTPPSPAITLHRPDGTQVSVKGCDGERLVAATPTANGVALQVDDDAHGTKLCLVDDRGRTRRVTSLGSATCGLARREPCMWDLMAPTSKLLVFSGMRGGVLILDAATGARLAYRGEPKGQFPTEYSTCGDKVCVEFVPEKGAGIGWMERTSSGVRFRSGTSARAADTAHTLKEAWVVEGELLMPRAP